MCAIVDADVRDQVFGDARSDAGAFFFKWLNERGGKLIVGGRLLQELSGLQKFQIWLQGALLAGRAERIDDISVNAKTEEVERSGICRSNDDHIIALAIIGGARLLFTNDKFLKDDFKQHIRDGKVYTTVLRETVTRTRRSLLSQSCD